MRERKDGIADPGAFAEFGVHPVTIAAAGKPRKKAR